MPDIFERIKEDHDRARELIAQIEATTDRAAKKRDELFAKFKIDLWSHNKVEEATFYAKLQAKGDDEEAYEAKNEHHMVNSVLEELDSMPKDNPQWAQKFKAMSEALDHHMEEEEGEFFDLGRKEFTKEEAEELGNRFDARKKVVVPALTAVE